MFNFSGIEPLLNLMRGSNIWIIVEGKKDKLALSKLGLVNVFDISGKRLEDCIEIINSKNPESVVILTDFDKEGMKKLKQLSKLLTTHGIKVNQPIRKKFNSIFRIQKIEELNSFIRLMEYDYYDKTCPIYNKIFDRSRVLKRRTGKKPDVIVV